MRKVFEIYFHFWCLQQCFYFYYFHFRFSAASHLIFRHFRCFLLSQSTKKKKAHFNPRKWSCYEKPETNEKLSLGASASQVWKRSNNGSMFEMLHWDVVYSNLITNRLCVWNLKQRNISVFFDHEQSFSPFRFFASCSRISLSRTEKVKGQYCA